MKFIIVKRTKRKYGATVVYKELVYGINGNFTADKESAVKFPDKIIALFISHGFSIIENIEYMVKPYDLSATNNI